MVSSSRPRTLVGLLAAACTLGLAACGGGTPEPADPVTVTAHADVSTDRTVVPTPTLPTVWPLTGVATGEGGVAARAALAVKIENSAEARPQTGLEQADMVWEEVVEGGITRFAAVYQSQVPTEVGPIRSVRPMDAAIVGPMKGIVAFSGGQQQYRDRLTAAGAQIFYMDAGDAGFYRKKGVGPAPHNVYGTPQTWWDGADANRQVPPTSPFSFVRRAEQATAASSGTAAGTLSITMSGYSHPSWTWDAASGTWLRSEGSTAAVSRAGVRLAATNVVVMRVQVVQTDARDPAGNPVPETVLEGTGEALVATGGKTATATWSKGAVDDPVVLTAADGTTVTLAPGSTWVELVPVTGSVTAS